MRSRSSVVVVACSFCGILISFACAATAVNPPQSDGPSKPAITSDPGETTTAAMLKSDLENALTRSASYRADVLEEEWVVHEDAKEERLVVRKASLVTAGDRALLGLSEGQTRVGAVVIDTEGSWSRSLDGFDQRNTPSAALLWCLPALFATETTWRILDLASVDTWESVVRNNAGEAIDYELKTKFERGGFSKYFFRFDVVGERRYLSRFVWEIWNTRPNDPTLRQVVSVELKVQRFETLGDGSRVPAEIERRAWLKDGAGVTRGNTVHRLRATDVRELPAEEAAAQIANARRPRFGETVDVESRKLRFVVGERWLEVAGVRFESKGPVVDVPTEAEVSELVRSATSEAGKP